MAKLNAVLAALLKRASNTAGEVCTPVSSPDTQQKSECLRVNKRFSLRNSGFLKGSLVLSFVVVLLLTSSMPVFANLREWKSYRGDIIRNADPSETIPVEAGQMTVRWRNAQGGDTRYRSADQPATAAVTHLSQVEFVPASRPMFYLPPGDTAYMPVKLVNRGNAPDTFGLSKWLDDLDWPHGVVKDIEPRGGFPAGDRVEEVANIAARDTEYLLIYVHIPEGYEGSSADTVNIHALSTLDEDPQKGVAFANRTVRIDTSSISVYQQNPRFDFLDNYIHSHDTQVMLQFEYLSNAINMHIRYTDPQDNIVTKSHSLVGADSEWILTDREGIHTFDVRYEYDDGELSDTFTDDIILDYTPPQNVNVEIAGGAEAVVDFSTTVSVYSEDSNPLRVYISNAHDFADSEYFAFASIADTESFDWNLDAGGEVFVKFIDAAGNVSDVATDTVLLDIPPVGIEGDTFIGLDARAYVTVVDPNRVGAGTVELFVTSNRDTPAGIYVDLHEDTGGYFRGYFRFTQGQSRENMISVDPESVVWAIYEPRAGSDSAVWLPEDSFVDTIDEVRTWPSPFRPLTGDPFVFQKLPADDQMEILIYNIQGQLVRRLSVGRGVDYSPFGNIARWWGRNDQGSMVASGIYIYVVNSQYGSARGQITLVK